MSKRRRWSMYLEWSLAAITVGIVVWALVDSILNH